MDCPRLTTSFLASLILFTAAPAAAEPPAKTYAGLFVGVHFFDDDLGLGRDADSDNGTAHQNGAPLGARVTRLFGDMFAGELELDVLATSTVNDAASVTTVGYRVNGLAFFAPGTQRLRPFALVGGGGRSQFSDDENVIGNSTIGFLQAGGGVTYRLGERYGVRGDLRLLLSPDVDGSLAAVDAEILFGAWLALDGPKAKSAARTGKAEDEPRVSEDDSDGDGVANADDRCQWDKEDRDGHDDDDGCPESEEDIDSDGDGVMGSLDKCPKEKENENGYLDDDGCRDDPPAKVAEFTGNVEGIVFATGSAKLEKSSFAVLDKAAAALKENPKLRVVIVGHTDDRGPRDANVKLSQDRAEAVKDYLIRAGVDADRLSAEGRGPDEPRDDNSYPEGRARNRRIEFKISAMP